MRIISNFKDYYDSAQAYGFDSEVIYQRRCEFHELHFPKWKHLFEDVAWCGFDDHFTVSFPLILFCGRKYPVIFDNVFLEDFTPEKASSQRPQEEPFIVGSDLSPDLESAQKINAEISGHVISSEIHLQLATPIIFLYQDTTPLRGEGRIFAITNPRLANFNFQSIFEPFACYQEIAMYLANQLAKPDIAPLRTGDDETIARAKGFDEKSFRTAAPGNKKLNRKQNRERKKQS